MVHFGISVARSRQSSLGHYLLIVLVDIRWFKQATNLGSAFSLRSIGRFLGLFPILRIQFGIVTRELFELNEEIPKIDFESSQVLVQCEETINELLYLGSKRRLESGKEILDAWRTSVGLQRLFVIDYRQNPAGSPGYSCPRVLAQLCRQAPISDLSPPGRTSEQGAWLAI